MNRKSVRPALRGQLPIYSLLRGQIPITRAGRRRSGLAIDSFGLRAANDQPGDFHSGSPPLPFRLARRMSAGLPVNDRIWRMATAFRFWRRSLWGKHIWMNSAFKLSMFASTRSCRTEALSGCPPKHPLVWGLQGRGGKSARRRRQACDCDSPRSRAAPKKPPYRATACRVSGRICLSCVPTMFCLLPQRPLVGGGTRRDGVTSHLRLNNGRFEPFNPSVDVFQRIGIHR